MGFILITNSEFLNKFATFFEIVKLHVNPVIYQIWACTLKFDFWLHMYTTFVTFHTAYCTSMHLFQADGGYLELESASIEPDKCLFHPDDSGRIMHLGSKEL
jgi:hypothetical protein